MVERTRWVLVLVMHAALACDVPSPTDAGRPERDAGALDVDAGSSDAGSTDAGATDAGSIDAGSIDAGSIDAGSIDAGSTDAGSTDAGSADAGSTDAGSTDAGSADAGSPDCQDAPVGLTAAAPRPQHTAPRLAEVRSPQGGATSWDGKLAFGGGGVAALNRDRLRFDDAGLPRFVDEGFWASIGQWHPFVVDGGEPAFGHEYAVAQAPSALRRLGAHLDAGCPAEENPFRSSAQGVCAEDGGFWTYDLLVVSYSGPLNAGAENVFFQRRAQVTVDATYATVTRAVAEPKQLLLYRTNPARAEFRPPFLDDAGLTPIRLNNHPALTVDGRVLLGTGEGGLAVYVREDATGPFDGQAFTLPELHAGTLNLDVGGVPFHERYPFAKQPLVDGLGRALGTPWPSRSAPTRTTFLGPSYAWLSLDGAEVAFTATMGLDNTYLSVTNSVVLAGARTNWALRYLDGPLNPDSSGLRRRVNVQSFGAFGSMWPIAGVFDAPLLPWAAPRTGYAFFLQAIPSNYAATRCRACAPGEVGPACQPSPSLPLCLDVFDDAGTRTFFDSVGGGRDSALREGLYDEVSLEVGEDRNFLVYLPMTHAVVQAWELDGGFSPLCRAADGRGQPHGLALCLADGVTPDLSGNFQTGVLTGAQFPQTRGLLDENAGVRGGRAVFVSQGNTLTVPAQPTAVPVRPSAFDRLAGEATVELWAHFEALSPSAPAPSCPMESSLVWRGNQLVVGLDCANRLVASVLVSEGGVGRDVRLTVQTSGDAAVTGLTSQGAVVEGRWYHVAVRVSAAAGRAELLVNGDVLASAPIGGGAGVTRLQAASGPWVLGPYAPSQPARQYTARLDEFAVSDVARRDDVLWRHALRPVSGVDGRSLAALVPAAFSGDGGPFDASRLLLPEPVTSPVAALGRSVFFESRWTTNARSCGTCHEEPRAFTDGRVRAANQLPLDNAPTVVNRALGSWQTFRGGAGSLEAQVTTPLTNLFEMATSWPQGLRALRQVPGMAQAFRTAFGAPQVGCEVVTRSRVERALGQYQRTLLSLPSAVDAFERLQGRVPFQVRRGRALFFGEARCSACHHGPSLSDEQFHRTGTAEGALARQGFSGEVEDLSALKTPTLRHLARTAPYFHDGSKAGLQDVLAHYARPVLPTERDVELRPVVLSQDELDALEAYLLALDGPVGGLP